ncbi:hypothetical protein MNBD_ALPHA12-2227 [hydrothermal vent metagenome]|uniref:Uncharacterized protein n=1 Tax=hydrothermal vent metagenome TaxID=652676 RepID=A0A3B0TIN0_9ZZZZ
MQRLPAFFAAAFSLLSFGGAAFAADPVPLADGLRGSYPQEWGISSQPSPLNFEIGMRYWYSLGAQQMSVFGGNYAARDVSHILELQFRIDDNSTATYLRGQIGYSIATTGTYNTPLVAGDQTINGGYIGYAGADFGYMPFGNDNFSFGGFAGYQYLADNPDMGRVNYITSSGAIESTNNATEIQALRLGGVVRAQLGDMFDINLQGAIIPYASLSGTYGAFYQPDFVSGGTNYEQGSPGTIDGRLYGASGEIMFGLRPAENLVLRLGARASYLTGQASMQYIAREVGTPTNSVSYRADTTGLDLFRYGALAEISGRF